MGMVDIMQQTPDARLNDLVLMHTGVMRRLVDNRFSKRRFEKHDQMLGAQTMAASGRQHPRHSRQQHHELLQWMHTRNMLGSVHDEVKRLQTLHHVDFLKSRLPLQFTTSNDSRADF